MALVVSSPPWESIRLTEATGLVGILAALETLGPASLTESNLGQCWVFRGRLEFSVGPPQEMVFAGSGVIVDGQGQGGVHAQQIWRTLYRYLFDAAGLQRLILHASEVTVRTRDCPSLTEVLDSVGVQLVARAAESARLPDDYPAGEWRAVPYPNYELHLEYPDGPLRVSWQDASTFAVIWTTPDTRGYAQVTFRQEPACLWAALESLLPVPSASPEELRYLFGASSAELVELSGIGGVEPGPIDLERWIGAVRLLVNGSPGEPEPADTWVRIRAAIGDRVVEVEVFPDHLSYAGQTYRDPGILHRLIRRLLD